MNDPIISDEERGKLTELAGPTGARIAGAVVGQFGDAIGGLPMTDVAKYATAMLAAAGIADLASNYTDAS